MWVCDGPIFMDVLSQFSEVGEVDVEGVVVSLRCRCSFMNVVLGGGNGK